ncbi:hypothetical protein Ancab_036169, partial [Ancistrocladus abbreviatus]
VSYQWQTYHVIRLREREDNTNKLQAAKAPVLHMLKMVRCTQWSAVMMIQRLTEQGAIL